MYEYVLLFVLSMARATVLPELDEGKLLRAMKQVGYRTPCCGSCPRLSVQEARKLYEYRVRGEQTPNGPVLWRKMLNPGLYIYHCVVPPVPRHVVNGMYGLILVEPEEGLAPVEREFYVAQSKFYTREPFGFEGLTHLDMDKAMAEDPTYVVFNGRVGSLLGPHALKARVGETVRIFFGVGGPNVASNFHVIGEIFDRVYPEAFTAAPARNVQTTLVPPGGATIVEFHLEVPGTYTLLDHAIFRMNQGAVGLLVVEGPANKAI